MGILPFIITWHLWTRRCAARMEGRFQSIFSVRLSISRWMGVVVRDMKKVSNCSRHDLQVLQSLNIPVLVPIRKHVQPVAWQKPAHGWFKLNTDGSSLGNPGCSGVGGIIRNDRGLMVYAFNSSIGIGTSNRAELLAVLQGLKACKELGINFVEIELDSQVVISWWHRRRCGVWYLEDFWEDTLSLMDSMVCVVCHVYREGNKVADWLARSGALGLNSEWRFVREVPRVLRGLIRLDNLGLPSLRYR